VLIRFSFITMIIGRCLASFNRTCDGCAVRPLLSQRLPWRSEFDIHFAEINYYLNFIFNQFIRFIHPFFYKSSIRVWRA
jgi:hypothetical protein